jgi:aspartate racemase
MADERVLGIVGGLGPESTIDYHRSIVTEFQRRRGDGTYPRLVINSIEAGSMVRHLHAGERQAV